jgi:hypothetical protein
MPILLKENAMPLSTLVGGFIVMLIIVATWVLCIAGVKFVMWAYDAYRWYRIKREFNKKFYRKDD